MAARITKGTDPIDVQHPVFMIFGQPGICKSSLAMSMRESLLLDFDMGVHRATNRRDSVQIPDWRVVAELLEDTAALEPYASIVVDTVGRCLDKITVDIIRGNAKMGREGALSQQGWGGLKSRFSLFLERVKAQGKDILLVSHDKEDKDGDLRIARPDIQGGSLGEVMKSADFVGYLYMVGKDRILDFSPTDRYVGKNPAGWPAMKVPEPGKATEFFARLYAQGREALGKITEGSAKVLVDVQAWTDRVGATGGDVAKMNQLLVELRDLSPILKPQVAQRLWDFAKSAGVTYDAGRKCFLEPEKPAPAVPVTQSELPAEPAPAATEHARPLEPGPASLFA